MTERSSNFKELVQFSTVKFPTFSLNQSKESIIVTITRNTTCHIQTKTEVRVCGPEVGTGQKFVKFLGQDYNHVLFSHFRHFLQSDLKKVNQLT